MTEYQIHETSHFTVSQTNSYRIPGYLIIQSRTECTSLADFSREQMTDLLKCLAGAETVVQQIIRPERIYIMKFGEVNPRVHFHVFPRTSRLAKVYLAHVQDKAPYCGARIVDWVWQNHKLVGFTDKEITDFVAAARQSIRKILA